MKPELIILLILGTWLGMVLGLSFLEAPLKFKAPNMTLTLGLGIGKLVFSALNKIEICFSIVLAFWVVYQYKSLDILAIVVLAVPACIVTVQSIWLLPALNVRVDQLLQGIEIAKSNHHVYFVGLEVLKVCFLIYGFIKLYNLSSE